MMRYTVCALRWVLIELIESRFDLAAPQSPAVTAPSSAKSYRSPIRYRTLTSKASPLILPSPRVGRRPVIQALKSDSNPRRCSLTGFAGAPTPRRLALTRLKGLHWVVEVRRTGRFRMRRRRAGPSVTRRPGNMNVRWYFRNAHITVYFSSTACGDRHPACDSNVQSSTRQMVIRHCRSKGR